VQKVSIRKSLAPLRRITRKPGRNVLAVPAGFPNLGQDLASDPIGKLFGLVFAALKDQPVKTGFINDLGRAKLAPGILNLGSTEVDTLNPTKSVPRVFDPDNVANVRGDKPRLSLIITVRSGAPWKSNCFSACSFISI
jgi:hypothetical protein